MPAEILNGRVVADLLLKGVAEKVSGLRKNGLLPKLAFVVVGEDSASLAYVREKKKACDLTGILYEEHAFDSSLQTEKLIEEIEGLNENPGIHGVLVQLPLPKHIGVPLVIRALNPKKDVDGFHAYNLGKMFLSPEFEHLAPCTPKGVIKLLAHYKIPMEGKNVTVVGASNIVGKPLSVMLVNRNATVTTCNIHTRDLKFHTFHADILVSAVGRAGLITADMVRQSAVVVDVGFNRVNGKSVGDVDFDAVSEKASYITPVPGGIGPMTVACLMENVIVACERLAEADV